MEQFSDRTTLKQEMDKGQLARLLDSYLKEWLEQFQEVIIDNLKRCPDKEMGRFRSLLVASEAFKAKIHSDILNGISAEQELLELQQEEQVIPNEEDYW